MITLSYWDNTLGRNAQQDIKFHTFSGGEEHVNILPFDGTAVELKVRLISSSDVMRLLLVVDCLNRIGYKDIILHMAYIPYARQDRVCQIGDAFSLKVFTNLINSLNFTQVWVADAHSSVATALLDRVVEKPQSTYAHKMINYNKFDYLISPDAGASKKSVEFASILNADGWDIEVVQALKVRDKSGSITNTNILHDNFEGKSCLMVDDICSGGMTFRKLAGELKEKGAGRIGLYITHGIFDFGVEVLLNDNIDEIYTTDSFEQTDPRVNVIHTFF